MSFLATNGCLCQCSFGMMPTPLTVLPTSRVMCGTPVATIMDHVPMLNIISFGMCTNPANPAVAAATVAAFGVLTPMPCIPATTAPWVPGSPTVFVGNACALNITSKLLCIWGGMIGITAPAQVQCQVP